MVPLNKRPSDRPVTRSRVPLAPPPPVAPESRPVPPVVRNTLTLGTGNACPKDWTVCDTRLLRNNNTKNSTERVSCHWIWWSAECEFAHLLMPDRGESCSDPFRNETKRFLAHRRERLA